MSDGRLRAVTGVLMPSAAIGAVLLASLAVGQYWKFILAMTMAAMLVGIGLILLVGFARCITLATGAMMGLGAYGTTLLATTWGWPYPAALAAALVIGAGAGFILGVPCVRFRSHNLAMVTLVFQATVIIVMREWTGLTGGAQGMNVPVPSVFGIRARKRSCLRGFRRRRRDAGPAGPRGAAARRTRNESTGARR